MFPIWILEGLRNACAFPRVLYDRNNHFQAIDRVNHASHRAIQLSPLCRCTATLFLASDTHPHAYIYKYKAIRVKGICDTVARARVRFHYTRLPFSHPRGVCFAMGVHTSASVSTRRNFKPTTTYYIYFLLDKRRIDPCWHTFTNTVRLDWRIWNLVFQIKV